MEKLTRKKSRANPQNGEKEERKNQHKQTRDTNKRSVVLF